MIVVVAFSSCLDVAAIEMEMGTPLDFNGELQTVKEKGVVVLLLLWAFCSAAVGRQPSFYNMMIFDFLFGVHIHRRRFLAVSWSAGRCLAVAALISAFFFSDGQARSLLLVSFVTYPLPSFVYAYSCFGVSTLPRCTSAPH